MEMKTRAVVLRAIKYGEAQMIVDLFARAMGRVSFICHLPKTNKGKVRKQFFQPLTVLDLSFDYRPNISLQHFRDIRIAVPFTSIPFDPYKLSISLFLTEFLDYTLRNEQRNEPLYDYVENSLLWLDSVEEQFANFHLVFMMRLTRFIGFFPNLTDGRDQTWFDLRNGAFVLQRPLHPDYLEPAEASKINLLMRMTYDNMHRFRMSRDERNRAAEIIITFYRLHVPGFPEMKSLPVLRELF